MGTIHGHVASTKILLQFFSFSLPICRIYFHLVMPRHISSPCYARYEHIRGIKGYVTYYLTCYVRLQVQNMHGCHLRKYGWGKWENWKKKL
jgi:sugar (pentulose or hexulose) kinase